MRARCGTGYVGGKNTPPSSAEIKTFLQTLTTDLARPKWKTGMVKEKMRMFASIFNLYQKVM